MVKVDSITSFYAVGEIKSSKKTQTAILSVCVKISDEFENME